MNSTSDKLKNFSARFLQKRIFLILSALLVAGISFGIFITSDTSLPEVAQVYQLTADEISSGSDIVINLPREIKGSVAKENIIFTPKIEGEWMEEITDNQIVFRPKEKLEVGMYYSVKFGVDTGVITKDFQIAEAPGVVAIFPAEESETHENSEITIIFNRPMVPITTLDTLDTITIPVEITPETEGKWKWIGTRTLQFQSTERLLRSSNYQVKIKPDFVSQDGLRLEGSENSFRTRPLRYQGTSSSKIIYNQPIRISFNQPVDLAKTQKEIVLKNRTVSNKNKGETIEFVAEYGKKKIDNKETKNKSVILVFQKKDQHGRSRLWDFGNNYSLEIKKVYPEEGDITLSRPKIPSITAADVVKNIHTSSERSYFSDLDFFDPEGKLWIKFYEDIDLDGSEIIADKLVGISYGEKCVKEDEKDEWVRYSPDIECEKETDKSTIYLEFDSEEISHNEEIKINLKTIKNLSGQKINFRPFDYTLKSAPKLEILRIFPDGEKTASLIEMTICTNSPLVSPSEEEIDDYIESNEGYKFRSWNKSWRVPKNHKDFYPKCKYKEFSTRISYYLAPHTDYQINLKTEDVFGAEAAGAAEFHTGKIDDRELNFYHLQSNYSVTTPDKTKLTFAVKNMEFVIMDICQLNADDMLAVLNNKPSYTTSSENITNCVWKTQKRIDLPKKYWDKNYFHVSLSDYVPKEKGHYLLTFSHPNYFQRYGKTPQKIFERSYLSVTNLGIIEKAVQVNEWRYSSDSDNDLRDDQKAKLKNLYWVTDLETLDSVPNAKIELFETKTIHHEKKPSERFTQKVADGITNASGIFESEVVTNPAGAVVQYGDDSALITSRDNSLDYASSSQNSKKIFLYTDRPIYRPGDEVQLKGIHRIGYDGDFEILAGRKVKVEIKNSNWDEVLAKEVELSDFGTFDMSFFLDTAAPLGEYQVQVENNGWTNFSVEEYVPAAFKVDSSLNQEEFISGDDLELALDSEYYFGVPLEGGEVKYSISSQNYYFDKYQDEYFSFGSRWYRCWYDCDYGDKFILRNKADIDAKGQSLIQQKLDFKQLFKKAEDRKSKIMVVSATVQNLNGQSVSTRKSFVVHAGEFYLGIKPSQSFNKAGEKFNLKVKSVDTEGEEISVNAIGLTISKVEWVHSRRKEVDGGYYHRWEKQLTSVFKIKIKTDKQGNWNDDIALKNAGEYEITAQASDSRGNEITNTYNIYIHAEKSKGAYDSGIVRQRNDTSLELVAENDSVQPGDTASIIIKNPFEKAKALIAIERGKIFNYEILDINQSLFKYDFPVTSEHIPNVFASVTLLSSDPAVKHGKINFRVDSAEKELDIKVQSDKKKYLPGEEVQLDFTVLDNVGEPMETELSVAVVDLSVLALKGNPKKNPLIFFYNNLPLTVATSSNVKNILNEIEIASGKGGGGGGADAKKPRGDFEDTAFWQAVIRTDADGKAQVNFTIPDNLTSWQVESVGITKDTKVGVAYEEFTTRKELMLIPIKPRFVVPGDELELGAKVFNQSDKSQTLELEFLSDTLQIDDGEQIKKISLKSEETKIINFSVNVPVAQKTGVHTFTLSAKNEELEDTVIQKIKITRNDTYEATATANYSRENKVSEYIYLPEDIVKEKGSLRISSSATLAVFLSDGLNSLLSFPYGCSEQIASKLDAIAIVKKGLNLENIGDKFEIEEIDFEGEKYTLDEALKKGLARLYESQNSDGGFIYFSNWNSNYHLTLHIAQTLINLKKSGLEIDESKLRRAFDFVLLKVKYYQHQQSLSRSNIIFAAALFSQDPTGEKYLQEIIPLLKGRVLSDEKFLNEEIRNIELTSLAILLAENPNYFSLHTKDKIYSILENRIRIDARGAHLPVSANRLWQFYETTEKDTALLLKALVADGKDNKIMDRILRWLLKSRAKDGAWGSTNSTLAVIDAFTDYLVWSEENKSDFSLDVVLDGEKVETFDFTAETILEQPSFEIKPLSEIPLGETIRLDFLKTDRNEKQNNFYYDIALKYFLPIDSIPPRDEGFTISRNFYYLDDEKFEKPIAQAKVGDVLRGHMEIIVPEQRNFVAIEDFIPAGVELINFNLATEDRGLIEASRNTDGSENQASSRQSYDRTLRPRRQEMRDDRLFLFDESLRPGTYVFDYFVRVLVPGKFHHLPAVISEMYFPENFARTRGSYFEVVE